MYCLSSISASLAGNLIFFAAECSRREMLIGCSPPVGDFKSLPDYRVGRSPVIPKKIMIF